MQEVPDLIGADGGKPPIRPLNIEMIDEFLPTIRRFVARFVALELRRQHQSRKWKSVSRKVREPTAWPLREFPTTLSGDTQRCREPLHHSADAPPAPSINPNRNAAPAQPQIRALGVHPPGDRARSRQPECQAHTRRRPLDVVAAVAKDVEDGVKCEVKRGRPDTISEDDKCRKVRHSFSQLR